MNLLVISERFWPEGSGGTLATYLITKLVATHDDFKVTVITGTRNPAKIDNVNFIIEEGFRIPNKPARWLYFLIPSVKDHYMNLMRKFDIIYIPYGCPLIPLAKELDKKVIVHLHDYQPIAYNSTILYNQQSGLFYDIKAELTYELLEHDSIKRAIAGSLLTPIILLCRTWMREADTIICVSKRQAEIIAKSAPELAGKLKVVYNPLPDYVPLIKKELGDPAFMYLGGDSYVKGFHVLLRTSQRLLEKGINLMFLLAGKFRGENASLVRRLGSSYNLLGYLKHDKVLKLHSISYALLFPSICEEPMPYAVLESMLAGTIPIASRVGGVPEIVEGTLADKFLFTPSNVDELVDKMEAVISLSREELIDIGLRLRDHTLRKFDKHRIEEQFLKILPP